MVSITEILAAHDCILVLDAASTEVQVGLLRRTAPAIWRRSSEEAGKSLFTLTDSCLAEAGLLLGAVRAFVFCAGPGSMLGVRTSAMALRTWQVLSSRPVYHYVSLDLLAHHLRQSAQPAPFEVIADARRDTWHVVSVDAAGSIHPLRRVSSAELSVRDCPVWQPRTFRAWGQLARPTADCTYDVAEILRQLPDLSFFGPVDSPDAFQHEAPEYKKWSAQVHSAATAPRK